MPERPADIAIRARLRGAAPVAGRPVAPLAVVSGCPRCGGAMRPDRLDIGDYGCVSCGHVEYARKDWPALMRGPKAGMRL